MKNYEKHLKTFDAFLVLKNYSIATRRSYGGLLKQFFEYRVDQGLVGSFTLNQARNYLRLMVTILLYNIFIQRF